MSKLLSERLEMLVREHRETMSADVLRSWAHDALVEMAEAAALARRVEGAAVRNVVGQQWDDVFAREGNVVWCSDLNPGQRVRLVPEVGS